MHHIILIITHVPNFHYAFILPQSNLWHNMNPFYLHLAFLSWDDRYPPVYSKITVIILYWPAKTLCRHWMQSKWPARSNWWSGQMARVKGLWYTLSVLVTMFLLTQSQTLCKWMLHLINHKILHELFSTPNNIKWQLFYISKLLLRENTVILSFWKKFKSNIYHSYKAKFKN